ncbi:UvrD-helicase domain-containing protein [Ralstonia pickettii]|uniref:UvrD-helicase domain-containing protein n=1 Tax=Ralstonia pickettii TaxID=329 RepID=UPI0015BC91A2|nr:UvrD-helicase domain-containing protein [Ralstonia pickettii]NWK43327.1 UvrD-helicase domain-containing protein [Ralstonia pickettii]
MGNEFGLISGAEASVRPMSAGDVVTHPNHGEGTLVSGWEGHLEVSFPHGKVVFTDDSPERLAPTDRLGEWVLTGESEARKILGDFAKRRKAVLDQIRAGFLSDFLGSDERFDSSASALVDRDTYDSEKTAYVHSWLASMAKKAKNDRYRPDDEQAAAVGALGGHVQLVARAGSGKTETVANRAAFLQSRCGVPPDRMMLLAFNVDAAREMEERLGSKLDGAPVPFVMTFHALAYAIVPGAKSILVNGSDGADQSLDAELQRVLLDAMSDVSFEQKVRRLMLAHFRADWESIIGRGLNLDRDSMLEFRRGLASETLRGDFVKSHGEKVIANFLFEHGVPYEYEKSHRANGINYRPDFSLPASGGSSKPIVIEYFGMRGEPDYDRLTDEKRSYWAARANRCVFVELYPSDWNGDRAKLERELAVRLADAGVRLRRLSEDEIWDQCRRRSVLRFTNAVSGFVGRCRKQWLSPPDLRRLASSHPFVSDVERLFVDLASSLYGMYLDRLKVLGMDDFDGLLQKAVEIVESGSSVFSRRAGGGDLRRIRYLFIDEYQDFSELFFRLVDAIRRVNPGLRVFSVGDDWQAINRFAGSDLRFYRAFGEYFNPAERLSLATNRRSARAIVDMGNALMAGRGQPASYGGDDAGTVRIVDLSRFSSTSLEDILYRSSPMTPAILRILHAALSGKGKEDRTAMLLSVTNDLVDPAGGIVNIDRYLKAIRARLPRDIRDRVSISTAHGFKGKQADTIIVLDAFERSYPLIHPNWVFARVLGESLREIVDESRRLFYVALTRAKDNLFIFTESGRRSPFLDDIESLRRVPEIDWRLYPPPPDDDHWRLIKVSGRYESISTLIPDLKADGYRYRDLQRMGGPRTWDKPFRGGVTESDIYGSPWAIAARRARLSGIGISVQDAAEAPILEFVFVDGEILLDAGGALSPAPPEVMGRLLGSTLEQ